jgi:hypothetical protein
MACAIYMCNWKFLNIPQIILKLLDGTPMSVSLPSDVRKWELPNLWTYGFGVMFWCNVRIISVLKYEVNCSFSLYVVA